MRAFLLSCALLASASVLGCERQVVVNTPATSANAPVRGITVTGDGEVKARPDLARLLLGVEARAPSAEIATRQVTHQMERVVTALKKQGIAEKDLQTRELSVMFDKPYPPVEPPPPMPPTPMPKAEARGEKPMMMPAPARTSEGEYRVSNLLEVTVRDLGRLGQVISTAMAAGANRMHGVTFDIEDPTKVEAKARELAIAKARARAQELARLSGVKLGPVVSITEQGGFRPMPMGIPMAARMEAGQDMPVERGELTVRQEVQVVFAIPESD